jgi:hypothetical protein
MEAAMKLQIAKLEDVDEQERVFYLPRPQGGYVLDEELAQLQRAHDAQVAVLEQKIADRTALQRRLLIGWDIDGALRKRLPHASPAVLAKKRADLLRDLAWPSGPDAFHVVEEDGQHPRVETADGRRVEDLCREIFDDPLNVVKFPPRGVNANPWVSIDFKEQQRLILNEPGRARELAMKAGVPRSEIWW